MVLKHDFNVENLEGKGLKARVTNGGNQFSSYTRFAVEVGHPEAAGTFGREVLNASKIEGSEVYVLARGDHEMAEYQDEKVYVCQTKAGEKFLIGEDGIELIETKPDLSKVLTDDLYKEIERRAFEAGFEEGKAAGVSSVTAVGVGIVEPKEGTAEIAREEVVRRAKADIEELKKFSGYFGVSTYRVPARFGVSHCAVEFVINREKRTVVALLKGVRSDRMRAKGIAKCAPTDCFNGHIGKAIALRRALGIDIPEEYLNAPAPKGVRNYDLLKCPDGDVYKVTPGDHYEGDGSIYECQATSPVAEISTVIDDTARYE